MSEPESAGGGEDGRTLRSTRLELPRPLPRWRPIVVPPEHGSWSLVLEPLLLGLLVAPSTAGAALVLAGLAAFLAWRPVKLAAGDRRRGKRYPRTRLAEALAAALATVAAAGAAGAWLLAGSTPLLVALLALPLGVLFAVFDVRPGRSWQAELAAGATAAAGAAVVAAAGGVPVPVALVLWVLAAGRSLPSILYVRRRLAMARGEGASPGAALLAHLAAIAVAAGAAVAGLAPRLAWVPFVLLLGRATLGLLRGRRATPKQIGIAEIAWGAATVLLLAAAYRV